MLLTCHYWHTLKSALYGGSSFRAKANLTLQDAEANEEIIHSLDFISETLVDAMVYARKQLPSHNTYTKDLLRTISNELQLKGERQHVQ